MAASEELRIVPVRGLNDIHKKRTHLPKPVMGLLQGLQYSLPTFAFHTFVRGYSKAFAEAATPMQVTPERVWSLMKGYGKSGALPIIGTTAAWFAVRNVVDAPGSADSFLIPLGVSALPAIGLAAAARGMPSEPVMAGLVWAATWHFWTQHFTPYADNGYKGAHLSRL